MRAVVMLLVFAYDRGGATTAGLVALAQLVPAAVLAPVAAAVADRSPVAALAGGYLAQAAGMAACAAAMVAGAPLAAYAAAIVASAAVTTTRPAQSTLIPVVCATPDQLTAANVVVSWVEATGILTAGLLTGLLISAGGTASVFAACAALILTAAGLVITLRVTPLAQSGPAPAVLADLGAAMRLAGRQPGLRVVLALLTAEAVVVGGLDVLFVILAACSAGRRRGRATSIPPTARALYWPPAGRRANWPTRCSRAIVSGALPAAVRYDAGELAGWAPPGADGETDGDGEPEGAGEPE